MIYFIENPQTGLVKIGTSSRVYSRLATLSSEYKMRLVLLGVMDGSYEVEKRLHKHFGQDRVRREWFRKTPKLMNFIRENADKIFTRNIEETHTVRVTERTMNFLEIILSRNNPLKVTADDIIWYAFQKTFSEELEKLEQMKKMVQTARKQRGIQD